MGFFGPSTDAHEEKKNLKRQLNEERRANRDADQEIGRLRAALHDTENRYRQAAFDNNRMRGEHNDELTRMTIDHSSTLDQLTNRHNQLIASERKDHTDEIERMTTSHKRTVESLKNNHDREMSKLLAQLLDSKDDYQGWPDDVLKVNFRELQRQVEAIGSHRHQEFKIPVNAQLNSRLDPTRFITQEKETRLQYHRVLKSLIWSIIVDQYFSIPFGFGILGPGEGQNELKGVYLAWRQLFQSSASELNSGSEDYAVFYQDSLANKWRSATFQYIQAALTESGEVHSNFEKLIVIRSNQNTDFTERRIMTLLAEVANTSGSTVRREMEGDVRKMVNLARDISIQFGINTAQLRLLVPQHGEIVEIGKEYQDCIDAGQQMGKSVTVEFVTVPGLQKVGNGRSDMDTKRIIVPCDILKKKQGQF